MSASPLGRYAPEDDGGSLRQVHLLGVPLRILLAGREHHDGLMREFRLMSLAGPQSTREVPAALVALTEMLGQRYGAARERPDQLVDEALDRGEDTIDLVYEVPAGVAAGAVRLEELMDAADAFCANEQLMSLERPATVKLFGRWYLEQFVTQLDGAPPARWDGPLDP